MNKLVKIPLILIGALLFSYSIISVTGILKAYKCPTIANEPNLKINTLFLASNLVTPKIGDFVCYNYEDQILGKHIRVHRLCGKENDVLEIRNGIVYLNKKNIDEPLEAIYTYKVPKEQFENIKAKETFSKTTMAFMTDENNVMASLPEAIAQKYALQRIMDEKGKPDKAIVSVFNNNWNKDNFGPIKIPTGKIFVMGDNRDNSEDSRYLGFIDESAVVGTVVGN